jgi:hypothetical protein
MGNLGTRGEGEGKRGVSKKLITLATSGVMADGGWAEGRAAIAMAAVRSGKQDAPGKVF